MYPVAVPVGTPWPFSRLDQHADRRLRVSVRVAWRQYPGDRITQRRQIAVVFKWFLIDIVSGDRLEALRVNIFLAGLLPPLFTYDAEIGDKRRRYHPAENGITH